MKNALAKTHTIQEAGTGGTYNSWEKSGGIKTLIINGSGFGGAPTVEAYCKWTDGDEGVAAMLDAIDVGSDFSSFHYSSGLAPNYFSLDGSTGVGNREGGIDADIDNRRTGYVRVTDDYAERLIAFDFGLPLHKFFSGTTQVETLPTNSILKMFWETDQPLDQLDKADVVTGSWIGNSWVIGGNQVPFIQYITTGFAFGKWNSILNYQKAGADPFVDNGICKTVFTVPGVGTITKLQTDSPIFGAGATGGFYNHASFPGWSGSGPQDNTLMLHRYFYRAIGANSAARIELSDSPDYAPTFVPPEQEGADETYTGVAQNRIVIPCGINVPGTTWTDTQLIVFSDSKQREGRLYYHVHDGNDNLIQSGVAQWQ